uniref:Uncharacterized protein n=1 Tax=Sphaerodactylus townsendi TaxID=933632 RepID=A0ACB8G741_9SAUR
MRMAPPPLASILSLATTSCSSHFVLASTTLCQNSRSVHRPPPPKMFGRILCESCRLFSSQKAGPSFSGLSGRSSPALATRTSFKWKLSLHICSVFSVYSSTELWILNSCGANFVSVTCTLSKENKGQCEGSS